jgi:hypothetical protein
VAATPEDDGFAYAYATEVWSIDAKDSSRREWSCQAVPDEAACAEQFQGPDAASYEDEESGEYDASSVETGSSGAAGPEAEEGSVVD